VISSFVSVASSPFRSSSRRLLGCVRPAHRRRRPCPSAEGRASPIRVPAAPPAPAPTSRSARARTERRARRAPAPPRRKVTGEGDGVRRRQSGPRGRGGSRMGALWGSPRAGRPPRPWRLGSAHGRRERRRSPWVAFPVELFLGHDGALYNASRRTESRALYRKSIPKKRHGEGGQETFPDYAEHCVVSRGRRLLRASCLKGGLVGLEHGGEVRDAGARPLREPRSRLGMNARRDHRPRMGACSSPHSTGLVEVARRDDPGDG